YCFGQMQDKSAIDILVTVLEDVKQDPIVRHEAAEALGAIGSEITISCLQKYKADSVTEVAETCELALDRISWFKNSNGEISKLSNNPYNSVDPAPPAKSTNINSLKYTLTDEKASLFERYQAMFALRNIGSLDAVEALGKALKFGGALFKHEVAFVLGQIQHKNSVSYLKQSLEDITENEMVRHECA
nr:nero [Cucujiformia]